jgi:hypothetical protein
MPVPRQDLAPIGSGPGHQRRLTARTGISTTLGTPLGRPARCGTSPGLRPGWTRRTFHAGRGGGPRGRGTHLGRRSRRPGSFHPPGRSRRPAETPEGFCPTDLRLLLPETAQVLAGESSPLKLLLPADIAAHLPGPPEGLGGKTHAPVALPRLQATPGAPFRGSRFGPDALGSDSFRPCRFRPARDEPARPFRDFRPARLGSGFPPDSGHLG